MRRVALALFALAALLALAVSPIASVWGEMINPDEFEHLHASFSIASGLRIYTDFYELHAPLVYYLLAPVVSLAGPDLTALFAARGVMLLIKLGTLWLVFRCVSQHHGSRNAAAAALIVASETVSLWWGQRIYGDVPAAAALALGAWNLTVFGRGRSPLRAVAVGACAAAAVLCNLKALFPTFGLLVAAGWLVFSGPKRAALLGAIGAGGVGVCLATALLIGLNAVPDFWRCVIEFSFGWKARHSVLTHVLHSISKNPAVWAVLGGGALLWLVEVWRELREKSLDPQAHALPLIGAFGVVGAAAMPDVWEEYLVELVPLFMPFAAKSVSWLDRSGGASARSPASWITGAVLVVHLVWLLRPPVSVPIVAVAMLTAFALGLAARAHRAAGEASLAVAAAVALLPAARYLEQLAPRPCKKQLANVERVQRWVAPGEPILDGYTGWGALRPHVYYYWMIHRELQMLLTERERGVEIVGAMQQRPPKLVIWDHDFDALEPVVHDYVRAHYVPTEHPRLWLRRTASTGAGR